MPSFPIIATIACIAYGIESIFGFGGTIIFLGLSGLFHAYFDFLEVIVSFDVAYEILLQVFTLLWC